MSESANVYLRGLMAEIVGVVDSIAQTDGVPRVTQEMAEHSVEALHNGIHSLALWLRELLEWAPLAPETRADVMRLSGVLAEADSGFHMRHAHA